MRLILTLLSILTLTGCKTKPEVTMYMRFDKKTGEVHGTINNEGKIIKLHMESYKPFKKEESKEQE